MKKAIVIAIIILSISFLLSKGYYLLTTDKAVVGAVQQQQVSASASSSVETQSMSTSSVVSLDSSMQSSSSSSIRPLSFPRVDPPEQIGHFLNAMDETALPKMKLPKAKKDETFDYAQATMVQLKERALAGDAYAAFYYANYIAGNVLRIPTPKGWYTFELNPQKQAAGLAEMREFYVRAMQGGIAEAAFALSREYSSGPWWNAEESLAWRKVSFALGESERYDCLRDSTTCVVKDYNNLLEDSRFFPCVSGARDQCTPELYQDATLLAMQYVYSSEFAMRNGPKRTRR